ncbi:hypothetical protein I4U23_005312 [Adineta vaga]|nr:hypothetical protein I4U23_005312 [Adineta vaga]
MNNYNYYANMSKEDKNDMCNNGIIKQSHGLNKKYDNVNNVNKKLPLKRTNSKMDHNQDEYEVYQEDESEDEANKWKMQTRSNRRGNKALRTESFIHGRTIRSSTYGHGRTENKNSARYISEDEERKKEERQNNQQLSNVDNNQYATPNGDQYMLNNNTNEQKNTRYEEKNEKGSWESMINDQIYVSRHAMKFAVEERFPPIKIKCEPSLKSQEEASLMINELLKHIEQNFKKLNPQYSNPLGFDHYMLDKNGDLLSFTKYIELFIYMCDINNYPTKINDIKIEPILPSKLPARNVLILKFIDNKIKIEDINIIVKEKVRSVYAVEEMLGTKTNYSRHIRIDLLSKEEHDKILISGKFVIDGHLYGVDEFLPSPKLLLCNKCNTPGHIKKHCKSSIDICRRCGKDRNDGENHYTCNINCHHCGGEHEATSYACSTITKFRKELLQKLKNNSYLLPQHLQFYIPRQFRDQKRTKFLTNENNNKTQPGVQQRNLFNGNTNDRNAWPSLTPNTDSTSHTTTQLNSEIKKLYEELHTLKREHENELKNLKAEQEKQTQKMVEEWQLFNLQIKTQAEAMSDMYTNINEIIPPMLQSIEITNQVMEKFNNEMTNKKEKQTRETMIKTIGTTLTMVNNRMLLLENHHLKLKEIMDKQNELLMRGMYPNDQSSNEQ